MERISLSTNAGDIDRWAGEYGAEPVRDDDGDFAMAEAGDVGPDRVPVRWDEFHAERDETTVVALRRAEEGADELAVVDAEAALERMDVSEAQRREALDRLGDGETVTVTASEAEAPLLEGWPPERAVEPPEEDHAERRGRPTDRDVGKVVVAPDGDEVGIVTAVEGDDVFVDPHPGLTESALATLGWTGVDEDDVRVDGEQVERVTTGAVRLGTDVESESFDETTTGR